MNDNKILSIIIPVFNMETYIDECLQSVISNHNTEYEVLLINDGSTDSSAQICESYAEKYNYIKVFHQANTGLSGARNTGIKNACGQYILFLDSDDYLVNGAIEKLLSIIKSSYKDFLFIRSKSFETGNIVYIENQCGYEKVNDREKPIKIFKELDDMDEFWFAAWLVVINSEFLKNTNLYFREGIYHEDELWVPQVFANARNMELVNYCLYCYRNNRSGSIINKKNIKKEFDKLIVMDELKKISLKFGDDTKKVFNKRIAALEWGMIRNMSYFESDSHAKRLYTDICKRLKNLKCGKYHLVYIVCCVIGVRRVSTIIGKGRI